MTTLFRTVASPFYGHIPHDKTSFSSVSFPLLSELQTTIYVLGLQVHVVQFGDRAGFLPHPIPLFHDNSFASKGETLGKTLSS